MFEIPTNAPYFELRSGQCYLFRYKSLLADCDKYPDHFSIDQHHRIKEIPLLFPTEPHLEILIFTTESWGVPLSKYIRSNGYYSVGEFTITRYYCSGDYIGEGPTSYFSPIVIMRKPTSEEEW